MGRILMHLRVVRRMVLSCGVYAVLTFYFTASLVVWFVALTAGGRWRDGPYRGGRALARAYEMILSALFVCLPLWALLQASPSSWSRVGVLFTLLRLGRLPRLLVPAGTGLTALGVYCTVRAWGRRYWGFTQRVHITLHTLAGIVMVLWWSDVPLARLLA
jgi:hypothetical protein